MKKMILSIAIAAFSMTTLSALTAQEAQAKKFYRHQVVYFNPHTGRYYDNHHNLLPPFYRPNKYTTVKRMGSSSKHSKKHIARKPAHHRKGKYQGGNSVPHPPRASVKMYKGPVERR
ncbi:MAG: hypothetical protein IJ566_01540 [Cardiobacteriaceae bacterium]|nr:hypothetical protein [Cardiobacteriaceae bacterium]